MDVLDQIVERRIAEAIARGEFEDLPGVGSPLALEDDPLVPEDLRVAYRVMKNAGYVPDEVRLFGEIGSVEQLLREATRDDERAAASARLRLLLDRIGSARGGAVQSEAWYFERLLARLG
jgi:DnaJ homologue, subfamily C, member 28, conserved domain